MLPPPPGILSKSAQAIENKGNEHGKERQEGIRARKLLKGWNLPRRAKRTGVPDGKTRGNWELGKILGGNADDFENKGLAGKATQKLLKTTE